MRLLVPRDRNLFDSGEAREGSGKITFTKTKVISF